MLMSLKNKFRFRIGKNATMHLCFESLSGSNIFQKINIILQISNNMKKIRVKRTRKTRNFFIYFLIIIERNKKKCRK